MPDQHADIEESDSQDISEIRRKALALLERCGGNSDEEIDYDDEDDEDDEETNAKDSKSPEMKHIHSSELLKEKDDGIEEGKGGRRSPRRRKRNGDASSGDTNDDDDDDEERSYGDEELDPLVKAVRELSYSLETEMVERQDSTVSRLTDMNGGITGSICWCCKCCCCQRWSRRTQCLVVWIIVIVSLAVSYYLFLTQYPHLKRRQHAGGV
ncbi:unnamed protein product [Cylindrotheca closterium]|uniref:Uncharacterized protein n=1 Tax=Cylindrotheca closterium TaxID=2856 RepID=A0AAD2CPB8_9STRA|nr:unnamed protein product [Cylindrotheca closterium]